MDRWDGMNRISFLVKEFLYSRDVMGQLRNYLALYRLYYIRKTHSQAVYQKGHLLNGLG